MDLETKTDFYISLQIIGFVGNAIVVQKGRYIGNDKEHHFVLLRKDFYKDYNMWANK